MPQEVWGQESLEAQSEGALSQSLKPGEESPSVLSELWARGLGPSPEELQILIKHSLTPTEPGLGEFGFVSVRDSWINLEKDR